MKENTAVDYRFMRIDGIQVRYSVQPGTGDRVLLLFNGIGASMELLQPFIDELRSTTIVAYDVPGAGASASPGYPWRPRRHAALAAKLLDRQQAYFGGSRLPRHERERN